MARKARARATFGRPQDHSHDYTEFKQNHNRWDEVFEHLRRLHRTGRADLVRFFSIPDVMRRNNPGFMPVTLKRLNELQRICEIQHSRAQRFIVLGHTAPTTRSTQDQSAMSCVTIGWAARGEDFKVLLDAIDAHQ